MLEDATLLVNTTSLGQKGQPPLEIDLARLPKDAAVDDIVYVPLETPLLAAARALPQLEPGAYVLPEVPLSALWGEREEQAQREWL